MRLRDHRAYRHAAARSGSEWRNQERASRLARSKTLRCRFALKVEADARCAPPPASYFAALAPAAAASPSCCPVPPLAPIAPTILPFTTIGRPPSDATGFSGNVVNAVLPAAYWSAKALLGRRNS